MRSPGKHTATGCCGRYSKYYIIALIFILGVATGCGPSAREVESFQGSTMGTTYSIKYVQEKSSKGIDVIKKAVDKGLGKINSMMSTWDPESNLSLINKADADQWLDMPSDLSKLIDFAFDLSRKTDGKYDVSIGPLINLWGFGPGGARKIPTDLQIAKTMKISGYDKIELNIKANRLKK
jgi:thiamine biosynthesis lipoprotein